MPSSEIYQVNHLGLAEGQPYLLIFYDRKGNPTGDDDTRLEVLDDELEIKGVDEETYDYPNDDYDTAYVEIGKYDQKDDQEDHEEDYNYHKHKNYNLDPPQDNNHYATQEQ